MLDHCQGGLDLFHGETDHLLDLLQCCPEVPVVVEVSDDGVADLLGVLGVGVHVELPGQVVGKVLGFGQGVLEGRQFGAVARP